MKQRTLKRRYSFEGKGLHTGVRSHMVVGPAPENTGIRFLRIDLGPDAFVDAVASNVSSTSRSTTISAPKRVKVSTIEHLMSALTGLGVDNALISIDAGEVPILDGSAKPYVEAFLADGLEEQNAERKWLELKAPIEYKDSRSGAYIRIEPSDTPLYESTIDFNSKVLGVQKVTWSPDMDYAAELAPCRTFCFLHEIQHLAALGLVRGGDVENAIVIVERPVSERMLGMLSRRFHQPMLSVTPEGYLSNVVLHFPDECGRHKLMDLIGDIRLAGGFVKAKITAFKPGHSVNTAAARMLCDSIFNS
ncbi:MAG: UDP-3-O-acyl-N-acetylglucosamine deacetylase [Bacteroidales bacterium]|nr:UDP-3-O-acyl-N-acetylglucosamine deacetylase [Bacteroidales bacterium]